MVVDASATRANRNASFSEYHLCDLLSLDCKAAVQDEKDVLLSRCVDKDHKVRFPIIIEESGAVFPSAGGISAVHPVRGAGKHSDVHGAEFFG